MNAKAKGSRRERQTIEMLQAQGFAYTESGGSLGIFDLIGIAAEDVLLVQVKSNRWPTSAEVDANANFATPANFRKVIHRWLDGCAIPNVREVE